MRVAESHLGVLVAHQLHHGLLVSIVHPEMASEAMPKVVERKVFDSCSLHRAIEPFSPTLPRLAIPREQPVVRSRVPFVFERLKSCSEIVRKGNRSRLAVLRIATENSRRAVHQINCLLY